VGFIFPIIKKITKRESFLFICKTHHHFYNKRCLFCNNEKSMKFNNPLYEHEELTYEDVFIFQQYFEGKSRIHDVNITPKNKMGLSLPLISANMNAVTGKRMCETLARYGGIGILPQDMELSKMLEIVTFIKSRHIKFDTPLTLSPDEYVRDALSIINKRAHKCVITVDEKNHPLAIFTPSDLEKYEQFTRL